MWLALLVGSALAARPVWDEEQLTEVTEQALDILPWHHYVLRTQQMLDKPGNFAELSMYGSPGSFPLPNGVTKDGTLVRFGIGMGLGAGKPATGFAAFGGLLVDYGMINSGFVLSSNGTMGMAADGVFYGGMAYKGWTATASALADQPFAYTEEVGGTPVFVDINTSYTLYNQQGVAVGVIRGRDDAGQAVLSAIRGELRPEKLLEKTELRKYGVFAVGLTRFARGLDLYQEAPPGEDVPATYELPLAADDIGEAGFRVQIVPELAPKPTVRRVQAGYLYLGDKIVAGAQAGVLNRGHALSPTVQVYTAFHPEWFKYFSFYGVPRITVSYAYNAPDPISFFQVDKAHVIGVQYIYGREEFARPLLPIYRTTEELEDASEPPRKRD